MRNLTTAIAEAKERRTLPSRTSLLLEVARGPAWKQGACVVAGILNCEEVLHILADREKHVDAFDTTDSRVDSVLGKMPAFRMPNKIRNVEYHLDALGDFDKPVGTLILLRDIPLPCMSFLHGATIVGEAPSLREALKGQKFFPRAAWQNYAAMEIA